MCKTEYCRFHVGLLMTHEPQSCVFKMGEIQIMVFKACSITRILRLCKMLQILQYAFQKSGSLKQHISNVSQSVETAVQRSKYLFKIYHNILYKSIQKNFPKDDTTDVYSLKIMSELSTRLKHITATDMILHRFDTFITLNVFCKVEQYNGRIYILSFLKG